MHPEVCEAADNAQWRSHRLSTKTFFQREWERGKKVTPLFSVFGIFNFLFKIDWLHCADLGIAADFLGNLFAYLVEHKMPGANQLLRCQALGEHIQKYYEDYHVEDRLKEFLPKTYKAESKKRPPKLKGNAASTRALAKFGNLIAKQFLSDDDQIELAMKSAAYHPHNCYESLHLTNQHLSHEALYSNSKNFALQYGALHAAFGGGVLWRPMPKMHMFLELCSASTEPQKFWNYRDEDFGGSVAKQSRMKGMWKKLCAYSKHALDMFRMKNSVPRIVE